MVLYGAGGHAKAVYGCLKSAGVDIKGVFDDDALVTSFMNHEVIMYDDTVFQHDQLIICIGDNVARRAVSEKVRHSIGKAIHHASCVEENAEIGSGSVVMPNATIQPAVFIGPHSIVNTASVIEHDCHVEAFAHIGPGSVLCGNVSVGEGALIGANATILPGVKIGAWSIVGAGAIVTKDVTDHAQVVGMPAKELRK